MSPFVKLCQYVGNEWAEFQYFTHRMTVTKRLKKSLPIEVVGRITRKTDDDEGLRSTCPAVVGVIGRNPFYKRKSLPDELEVSVFWGQNWPRQNYLFARSEIGMTMAILSTVMIWRELKQQWVDTGVSFGHLELGAKCSGEVRTLDSLFLKMSNSQFDYVWHQKRIPVIMRRTGKGQEDPCLLGFCSTETNREWLRNKRRTAPVWNSKQKILGTAESLVQRFRKPVLRSDTARSISFNHIVSRRSALPRV